MMSLHHRAYIGLQTPKARAVGAPSEVLQAVEAEALNGS